MFTTTDYADFTMSLDCGDPASAGPLSKRGHVRAVHNFIDVIRGSSSVLSCFLLALFLRLLFFRCFAFVLLLALDQLHIRNMNWSLPFGDLATRIVLGFPKVLFDDAHPFNQHTLFSGK